MTLLAPLYLMVAAAVATGVVALHFLSTRDSRSEPLPTARFVPEDSLRATALVLRPSDLLLLMLRVLAVLLIGMALAQPRFRQPARAVATIVVVDASRAVERPAEVADSAMSYIADAAAVVIFDSVARELLVGTRDSLEALGRRGSLANTGSGSLSAAMLVALRAASRLRDQADSLRLVLVSPLVAEERDAATMSLRALWPGRIDVVRVAAASSAVVTPVAPERIVWADSGQASGWMRRSTVDTIGAVRMGNTVVVLPLAREWELPDEEVSRTGARVIARWPDGEPAAVDQLQGSQCVRSIGITLPRSRDLLLRTDLQRLIEEMRGPCGEVTDFTPLSGVELSNLVAAGPLAPAAALPRREVSWSPLTIWLLAAALLILLLEVAARRQTLRAKTGEASGHSAHRVRRAA